MPGGARGVGGLAISASRKKAHAAGPTKLPRYLRDGAGSRAPTPVSTTSVAATSDGQGAQGLPAWICEKPSGKGPRGHPIPIHVLRINMLQLQSIDQMAQTFMARFFVQQARRSRHRFATQAEEQAALIFNWSPTFVAKGASWPQNETVQQMYFFPKN